MDKVGSEMASFFFAYRGFCMVEGVSSQNYELLFDKFDEKGYVEVKSHGQIFRLKVLDDGGLGKKLSVDKIRSIINELVKNKSLTFSNHSKKRTITLEKEGIDIEGIHSPIILRMTKTSPVLRSIVQFFRKTIVEPLFGKKTVLTNHVTLKFRKVVEKLPENTQKKLLKDLRITHAEHYALEYFGKIIASYPDEKKLEFVKEALNGAYVQIEDDGKFYDQWINEVPHKKERQSSHESSAKQYSFQGPLFKECLFSKKKVVQNGKELEVTWFQLERYPMGRIYTRYDQKLCLK